MSERFVDVFRSEVSANPPADPSPAAGDPEPCIGCMVQPANVKLVRRCGDATDGSEGGGGANNGEQARNNRCVNCYCRPMWCVDCMAKW